MNFIELDPKQIVPCPWNSNVVDHENEEKLRASIERHGMFKPVLVREVPSFPGARDIRYECVGGWHRCEQAIELGFALIPACNLGQIDEARAKEISLADNARYGVDDAFKLSEVLGDLDLKAIENFMPWTNRDIESMTASLAVSLDDLDLDDVTTQDLEDEPEDESERPAKVAKTHTVIKFRVPLIDGAKITNIITKTMKDEGFTASDDMTNAGDALAFLLLQGGEDAAN